MVVSRISLPRGWKVWSSVWLRSAGFTARTIEELGSTELARKIDERRRLERALDLERERAHAEVHRALEQSGPDRRKPLHKVLEQLRKRRVPDPVEGVEEVIELLARIGEATRAIEAAHLTEQRRTGEALRRAAEDPRFREAILWQNRRALHGTIDALLRRPSDATDSKTREHQRLVASYLQRYCTKNETIGFMGPVGWIQLRAEGAAIAIHPGRELLSRRNTYLEHWGVDALAQTFAEELRPWLAPRRTPSVRLEGEELFHFGSSIGKLPPDSARVLAQCDGLTPAREIDAAIEDGYEILEQLADKDLILWTLEVPVWTAHPERALREVLERAPDEVSRAPLEKLARLESALDAIATAAGDPIALDRAAEALEATFEELTGAEGVRRAGEAYAGRTLFYEDCVRAIDCEIGPAFLERLGAPLALLLQSARWYTHEVGRRCEALLLEAHRALASEQGPRVDYLTFFKRADALLGGREGTAPLVEAVLDDLHRRWSDVLELGAEEAVRSAAALGPRVEAAFAAPRPGWPAARFHSPDVLISASSEEEIARGNFQIVIGEVHVAVNSLFSQVGVFQHPEPEVLFAAAEQDVAGPLLIPVESNVQATRADLLPVRTRDPQLELGPTRSPLPRDRAVAAADLIVEERSNELVIVHRSGAPEFPLMSLFGQYLSSVAVSEFSILSRKKTNPRVTIDGVVVERRRWIFGPKELFAPAPEPLARFANVRAWVERHALPRFVFAKLPEEKKPFFVDFESLVYVEIFARRAEKSARIALTEMLPDLEHLWLADAAGARYTSELRMVAVDPVAWR